MTAETIDLTAIEDVRAAINALAINQARTFGDLEVIAWQGRPGPARIYRVRPYDGRTLSTAQWAYAGSGYTGAQSVARRIAYEASLQERLP